MKEYIKNIIAESLKDEVDVDREWERLFSSIEKKTISKYCCPLKLFEPKN